MDIGIFSLKNKLALISGGGSGIGLSIATFLAKAGAKVILLGRNRSRLLKSQEQLRSLSYEAEVYDTDLSIEKNIKKSAQDIILNIGSPDIVVNGAGVNLRESADSITYDTWNKTVDINLKAPFFFTREFIPDMIKKKYGKVINIASLQSVRAFDNGIPYGAAKGGLVQLTRAMAQAYSRYGINVNAIAPGFFNTELTSSVFKDSNKVRLIAEQTAIGRNGELGDFEGIAIFLSSAASDYITGQTIFLDGGFTAK